MACHDGGPSSASLGASKQTEMDAVEANQGMVELLEDLRSREIEQNAEMSLLRMRIEELQAKYLRAAKTAEELQSKHNLVLEEHRKLKNEVASLLETNQRLEGLLEKQSQDLSGVDEAQLRELTKANIKLKAQNESFREQLAATDKEKQGGNNSSDEAKSFMRLFTCPNRKSSTQLAPTPGLSLHDTLWEVVRSTHGGAALLCRCNDLVITHVSKQAFAFFGNRARKGVHLGILANEEASKALLTQAIESWCHAGDGFWVQEMSGVDFATNRGVVDCAVVFVRIPAEPQFSKEAAILLTASPVASEVVPATQNEALRNFGAANKSQFRLEMPQRSKRIGCRSDVSAAPSGASSQGDVNPNDSVSNVGMLNRRY